MDAGICIILSCGIGEKIVLRKLLPTSVKLHIQLLRREIYDRKSGAKASFACFKKIDGLSQVITTSQPIKGSSFVQNKIDNIRLGALKIEKVTILPNQVFSFWHSVGNPSIKRGFKEGRTIKKGVVVPEVGGGLCQLSGIIYHTALKANLTILERYNHSVDLYSEEERFAILGSDATVSYGYKDLRFLNTTGTALSFSFIVTGEKLICNLLSAQPISEVTLVFEREEYADKRVVKTIIKSVGQKSKHVTTSEYKKYSSHCR